MSGVIGQGLSRVEGPLKVRGAARYAAENAPLGLLYAAVVESTIAAGEITDIDVTAAERAAGVRLVLTHLNADRLPYRARDRQAVEPVAGDDLRPLQDPQVWFSGQPVGVVVADTQIAAEYAASLVEVTYDIGEALTSFDVARARPTSQAAGERGRGPEYSQGDPDGAMHAAAVRVAGVYRHAREQHNAMEAHATVAEWDGDRLTLWDKSQWVGNVRDAVAAAFDLPNENVRVINPYVGGAFGSGLRMWSHTLLAAMAARRVGRPVRLELTRRQLSQSTGFRSASEQHVALGADATGRLQAIIHEAVAQTSTHEEFADATLDVAQSTYACPNRRTRYRLVEMHTNTPCPMRGPGHVTGLVGQEIAIDELAVAAGLDPIELRLRNHADQNPKASLPWSSNRLRDCYQLAAERFGWSHRDPAPRSMRDGDELIGWGMATAMNPAPRYPTSASATLLASGSAVVSSATSDMGAGTYTSATQIAAETLGLPVERVTFRLGDSDLPAAKEHGGSTTLASVGPAVREACLGLRHRLNALARETGGDPEDPGALLGYAGLEQLQASASVSAGDWQETHSSYGFGAVIAEVRVDVDFGTVRVARLSGAYDGGRIVNPKLARSQCIGGMVQGIGMALLEAVEWDARLGRVMNANLADYLVPVNADVSDLDVAFVASEEPLMNPLGVKGIAELGLCGVAPAIANAVWHATGQRMRDLPITPDKLLSAQLTHDPDAIRNGKI